MTFRKFSTLISLSSLIGLFVACANDESQDPNSHNQDRNSQNNHPNTQNQDQNTQNQDQNTQNQDQNTQNQDPKPTSFESDSPSGATGTSKNGGAVASALPAATGTPAVGAAAAEGAGDAARAIEEADIIKVENNRLYALSQYGGLNVIDISERDNLKLLGREKVQAQPFEMYVRDSIVFALYNGYGEYLKGNAENEWNYVQTSQVIAFDTKDASNPKIVGRFSVPGSISDSRIVGNVLYVVGFETNSCWACKDGQHTTIISLDISDPAGIRKVDELSYAEADASSYSWKRSITVTDKRMYVAGPEYGENGPVGSTIQVVDISDPSGDLVEGTSVKAEGSVNSRWQMDEYNGHLRVISQPGEWRVTDTAHIQTYKVESSQRVTPLADVPMKIPANETLRSVRFDGARGYAITAEQKDPLFTIDLSDPAAPSQVGELEMPGWVYHMEPRGERVVALGYDQGNDAGALAISLFDVSDLAQPKMLDRVNFGGDWAWLSEDQDRIHKAFQVLDTANLILMPFQGWDYSTDSCNGSSRNGIQLVDWANDDLALRGVANLVGQPRRGFLHDERLFAVSEERVETFDIADRSVPQRKASLKLTQNVQQTVMAGNTLVKFAHDWYANSLSIETTTLANAESAEAMGHIDLAIGSSKCGYSSLGTIAESGSRVYLVINEYNYNTDTAAGPRARIVTVDVADPKSPKIIGNAKLDFGEGWSYWHNGSLVSAGAQSVAAGNAFAVLSSKTDYNYTNGYSTTTTTALHVLDMTDPNAPKVTDFAVPGLEGTTGLLASGTTIAFGRYEPSTANPTKVRFYVERFDVADASRPNRLAAVNVPGSIIAYDSASGNALTVDYKSFVAENLTPSACQAKFPLGWWEYPASGSSLPYEEILGTCRAQQQSVHLVDMGETTATVIGSNTFDIGQRIATMANGKDRMFMTFSQGYGYYGYAYGGVMSVAATCRGCSYYYGWSSFQTGEAKLAVVSGLSSGNFASATMTLQTGNSYGYSPMVAANDRVLMSTGWQGKLVVVGAANPTQPAVIRETPVIGSVSDLTIAGGTGIASLGYDGVQTIAISD